MILLKGAECDLKDEKYDIIFDINKKTLSGTREDEHNIFKDLQLKDEHFSFKNQIVENFKTFPQKRLNY